MEYAKNTCRHSFYLAKNMTVENELSYMHDGLFSLHVPNAFLLKYSVDFYVNKIRGSLE